jgi:membrane protein YdbS with pleckstrin-like domain
MAELTIRPSRKYVRAGYALGIILIAGIAIARATLMPEWPVWLPAGGALLLLWPLRRHLALLGTRANLSEDKLRFESGILSKTTRTIQISKIQDVRVDQTIGERLTGVGTLSIETAGETSRLVLYSVDNPQSVADQIIDIARHYNRHEQKPL